MHLGRRIVTIIASLALLQLVLLGSGVPCEAPMTDAGRHATHAGDHAPTAHTPTDRHASDAEPRDHAPSTDCGLPACAVSPVILDEAVTVATASPTPVDDYPPLADSPSSPVRSLDPPPPRA